MHCFCFEPEALGAVNNNALLSLLFREHIVCDEPFCDEFALVTLELDHLLFIVVGGDIHRAMEGLLHCAGDALEIEVFVETFDRCNPPLAHLLDTNMNFADALYIVKESVHRTVAFSVLARCQVLKC